MSRNQFLSLSLLMVGTAILGTQSQANPVQPKAILYGDGVHDDTEALHAWCGNQPVYHPDGRPVGNVLTGKFNVREETLPLTVKRSNVRIENCDFRTI